MLFKKEGFPEESEIVMCTVTSVQPHSVFVNIDDYGRSGMIHISEVSPGRIRNIRDYVVEGKKVACKVLRINVERGHVDLSLRRVTSSQRRSIVNSIKQEQKAEKILEFLAKEQKRDLKELYKELSKAILNKYDSMHKCFSEVVAENIKLDDLEIDKKLVHPLTELIKQRIKPVEVEIKGNFNVICYDADGVNIIRDALKAAKKEGKENLIIKYYGGGKYNLSIKAPDYKTAESILENATKIVEDSMEKHEGEFSFERDDNK